MVKGEILYRYTYSGQEVGGRLRLKEVINGEIVRTSKPVDYSTTDLNTLRITGLELEQSSEQVVELHLGVDNLLYNPYGDAPALDVKTVMKQIGFREWEFYDEEFQEFEKELQGYLEPLLKGRRLLVGASHIQLAPVVLLTTDIEEAPYLAISISRRQLQTSYIEEILYGLYRIGCKQGFNENILQHLKEVLALKFARLIESPHLKQTEDTFTCIRCRHTVISDTVIARCPRCLALMTNKEGVLRAW